MDQTKLAIELRRDEGVRYSPYYDNATPPNATVGVGHNLRAKPLPNEVYPLTDLRVDQILAVDLQDVFHGLDLNLPWWRQLDEVRQRVLANMCFNLGIYGLLTFKNTLGFMKNGEYIRASQNLKASKWYSQVGQRAVRLCQSIETGIMPN